MSIIAQTATATANGSGDAVFTFPDVPVGQLWCGTTSVPGAPSSMNAMVTTGGQLVGSMVGSGSYGPWIADHSRPLAISATGLTPGTQYVAVWHADDKGSAFSTYPAPITPTVTGSVSVPTPLPVSQSGAWNVGLLTGTHNIGTVGTDPTLAPVTGQATSNTSQVQLSAVTMQPPNGLLITALPTNAAPGIYFGATGVTTSTGDLLQPGATKPLSCPPNAVYIIGANNTDVVTWELL